MRKIKFKKLIIQNFLSIGNDGIEIDFQNGLNLITGTNLDNPERRNGTGKSALIEGFFYAVYGTTIRDIKKEFVINNVTKGKGRLDLSFDVQTDQSTTSYRIVRQLKPSTVELYLCGDEEKNISKSSITSTNQYICDLIGSNAVICKSCDILSLSDNTPFMAKKPEDKKKFIEDVFALEVFGKMLKDLKESIKENKMESSIVSSKISEISNSIDAFKKQYEIQKKQIDEREQVFKLREEELLEKIQTTQNEIDLMVLLDISKMESELQKYSEACDKVGVKIRDIEIEISKLNLEKDIKNKDWVKLGKVEGVKCDKCMQDIGEDHMAHIEEMKKVLHDEIDKLAKKATDLEHSQKADLVKKQALCNQKIRESNQQINQAKSDIQKRENLVGRLEEYKKSLIELKRDSETDSGGLKSFVEIIENSEKRKEEQLKKFEELKLQAEDYETTKFILGEEGVKSFIIKNLLDMLNASIQKYITSLGMTMRCKFDEYFDEQITNDRGAEISYWNFSGGERRTVDLACSWSFKDIKRKIVGVSSNVEFLDEYVDAAFDERGLDLLIEALKNRIDKHDLSCYAISHRKEMSKHVDGETINLEMENKITRRIL